MAVALVMGNMIGSGIFLLPASLAPFGGALSLAGWLISTVGALLLASVFARLARLDPAAGGPYAYTRRAFGDFAGFLVAWGYWISIWTSLGALAVAFVGYLTPFFPGLAAPVNAAAAAIVAVWLLIGVNIGRVRAAGWLQVATTVLKLVPLAVVGAAGLVRFDAAHFVLQPATARELMTAVPAAATLTLWAFLGLESATVAAGAIAAPATTVPRATLVGTALTAGIYVLSTLGVMSLLEPSRVAASSAPFADAAAALAGPAAGLAIAAGAAISCFGALNGWTLLAGQLPLAVARDGLFPSIFLRLSARGTPTGGLVIAGVLTTGLVLLNYTRGLVELFTFFILLATLHTLIPYVFSSLAVFLLRDSSGARLSRSAAVVAALAFVYALWAIGGAGQEAVYWGFLLLISGVPVYTIMTRRKAA
jgi:APA family basic amino acid/polyamine antiporter